jgi:hypothetical protein
VIPTLTGRRVKALPLEECSGTFNREEPNFWLFTIDKVLW